MDLNQPAKEAPARGSMLQGEPGLLGLRWRWARVLAAGLIVVAGLCVYANSFEGPFVYDDLICIVDNPCIRQLWPLGPVLFPPFQGTTVTNRPLLNLSLAINYRLGGEKVWGYHAANLAIHLACGLLLLGIVRRTLELPVLKGRFGEAAWGLAAAIALLWTVHPLQTESVTYIIQRAESLSALFQLLALYGVVRGSQSSRRAWWYVVAVGACFLGVAVKEIAITAPLVVLLYDRTFLAESFGKALRRRWGLYVGLFAAWGFLLCLLAGTGVPKLKEELGPMGQWAYIRSEPGVILHYLRLSVWPHPLCFNYEWPVASTWGEILPGALGVGLLLGATAWGLWKGRGWGFLGAWFFLILAPTSSIMPLPQLAFEHRMYLSLAGVIALVVMGAYVASERWPGGKWIGDRGMWAGRVGLVLSAAILFGFLTVRRNEVYQSALLLWQDTVRKAPYNHHAHSDLGVLLTDAGRFSEAIEHLEEAIRIKPNDAGTHNNLGMALREAGRVQEAIEHYQQAIALKPDHATAHSNLGIALTATGRVSEGMEHLKRATQVKPDDFSAHINLGVALAGEGRALEAIEEYRLAIGLKPEVAVAHNNLGHALAALGRGAEAIEQYQEAVRLKADYGMAHHNLAAALVGAGRVREAIEQGKEAARWLPNDAEANRFVAWLMATFEPAQGGDPEQAVELAQRACRLTGRRDIGCLDTLAAAYASAGRFAEAVSTAKEAWQKALAAGEVALAEELHMRLQLYRDGKPYREPAGHPAKGRR
jgi:tetratricopeptide (TPR) repeat protein